MERYLVFDSSCSVCNALAATFQEAVGTKLEAISIYGDRARTLLDRAFPGGWAHAPYLILVDENRVRAWTGLRLAVQLGMLIGPRKAWRVFAIARRSKVHLFSGANDSSTSHLSRRAFLKAGAVATAALGLLSKQATPEAHAVVCECNGNYRWVSVYYCTNYCGGTQYEDELVRHDGYNQCNERCSYYYTHTCGVCF